MKKVGIIGGSGYTGGELIRLILQHPALEIDFVYSSTRAGKLITSVHQDVLGRTDLTFTATINSSRPQPMEFRSEATRPYGDGHAVDCTSGCEIWSLSW